MPGDMQEVRLEGAKCPDEDCGGWAEPEVDGEHAYLCCLDCGFEFGYQRIGPPASGETCAIGVPEVIRRAASIEPQPVSIQTSKRIPISIPIRSE